MGRATIAAWFFFSLVAYTPTGAGYDFYGKLKRQVETTRFSIQTVECDSEQLARRFMESAARGAHTGEHDRGRAAALFLQEIKDYPERCEWLSGPVRFKVRGIKTVLSNLDLRDILFHKFTTLIMVDALVETERGEVPRIIIDVIRTPLMHRLKDRRGVPLKEPDE